VPREAVKIDVDSIGHALAAQQRNRDTRVERGSIWLSHVFGFQRPTVKERRNPAVVCQIRLLMSLVNFKNNRSGADLVRTVNIARNEAKLSFLPVIFHP
jgi:hypothetical protein